MPRFRAVLVVIATASFTVCCTPVITGGDGGGPGSAGAGGAPSGESSTSGTGASTVSPSCAALGGPTNGIFSQADAQGAWSDPATGLGGNVFLEPATAGSFTTGPSGTEVKYSQFQEAYGKVADDPSFGVWFSSCVDASAFSGVTFKVWPVSAPAASDAILRVLTVSTTPAPRGTCVPKSPETASTDCVAPSFDPGAEKFSMFTPYTVAWSQLSGAVPAQTGAEAAKEIIGLSWVINDWVGPPPQYTDIDVMVNDVAFVP